MSMLIRIPVQAIAVAVLYSAVFMPVAFADEGGPAFTEPSVHAVVPDGWIDEPVEYGAWAAGADVAVTLDQHLYPALLPIIEDFEAETGTRVAVSEGTCGISAGMLTRKEADMAGFCCPAGKSDRLPGVEFHTLGIASLALIVNPSNTVDDITLTQARALFSGRVYNWSGLDLPDSATAPDRPVLAVARLHCKNRPGHWRLMLDNEDMFSPRLREVGTIRDMVRVVASEQGAIGFEALWMLERFRSEGEVKPLKISGVSPADSEALVRGAYPLYRTYNITTWSGGSASEGARKLAEYLIENAPSIDKRYGIVPVQSLRRAGWRFVGDELVGAPD